MPRGEFDPAVGTIGRFGAHGSSSRVVVQHGRHADFARLLPFVGIRVLMPSVILVLLTGVGLVLADSEFRFSQLWVLLALALFAVAFLIGAVYLSRVALQLDRATVGQGQTGAGAAPLLNRWLVGYWVVLAVLLVAVWDMVFKPGL